MSGKGRFLWVVRKVPLKRQKWLLSRDLNNTEEPRRDNVERKPPGRGKVSAKAHGGEELGVLRTQQVSVTGSS